ncbi:hypothetical protein [Streptosporangium carneum]|uniref:EcsC family protein n=1 Tax=Streptosporangium carneum TaxID=47481 RepID=A0A9W6I9U0_9ACTN|nr:hypothetical protein [Streptosporangium carneum]GLK14076.1 hypothetical protein GCM10017600_74880 [Streptosporangium carneum]
MTSENKQTGAEPDDSTAGESPGAPDRKAGATGGSADAPERSNGALERSADASDREVSELVGRLAEPGDMEGAERRQLLGRLTAALARGSRKAKETGIGRGRWLADVFTAVAPRIPIRDLATLSEHHHGLTSEALADDLVRTAAKATMTVGALGGALAAAEFAAPPLLLSAPAQLVAETLVVAAIEVKLLAELHEVYGVQVPGSGTQRAMVFVGAWSKQRGVDPLSPASVSVALGAATKTALRNRLMRTLGRHLTTFGPFLTGAVAGGALNRAATRKLAEAVRADLRIHRALPPGKS